MRLREAVIDDARGIATVHVQTWQAAYRGIVPDDALDAMDIDERETNWRGGWSFEPGRAVWVAEEDDAIVGWSNAGPSRDTDEAATPGELYGIYVDASRWGTGVAQELMDVATAWLRDRFDSATLWTLEANVRARRFYQRNGWRIDGATKSDDRRGFVLHEVRYRITL